MWKKRQDNKINHTLSFTITVVIFKTGSDQKW